MRTQLLAAVLSVTFVSTQAAELAWDGVATVPAYAIPDTVNRYQVCSPGFQLRYITPVVAATSIVFGCSF